MTVCFHKERDGELDSIVITLLQHGTDRDFQGVCIEDKQLLEVNMRVSKSCTESTLNFFERLELR